MTLRQIVSDGLDRCIGLDDFTQLGDFTRQAGTELDHQSLRIIGRGQKGQWCADAVVVVAAGCMHAILGRENCAQHVLRCSLAVASGNGTDQRIELPPPIQAQLAQRLQRVLDQVVDQALRTIAGQLADHCTARTALQHVRQERVTVVAIAD